MPSVWTRRENSVFARLSTPRKIQDYIDGLRYSHDDFYRCPRRVIADRCADCADAALFAAAALRRIGQRPVLAWIDAVNDDEHVVAVFRRGKGYGAIGKSNFVDLRYREPVYRTLRELMMSYFEAYFNSAGQRTMRSFSRPLDLSRHDRLDWMTSDEHLPRLMDEILDGLPMTDVLPPGGARLLTRVDRRTLRAGLLGSRRVGLYKPGG